MSDSDPDSADEAMDQQVLLSRFRFHLIGVSSASAGSNSAVKIYIWTFRIVQFGIVSPVIQFLTLTSNMSILYPVP